MDAINRLEIDKNLLQTEGRLRVLLLEVEGQIAASTTGLEQARTQLKALITPIVGQLSEIRGRQSRAVELLSHADDALINASFRNILLGVLDPQPKEEK
jgi:hypothetical protein